MSKYIPGNQKHLSLKDREYIQKQLSLGDSFKDIARFLCKDPTTISKEVRKHRISDWYHKGSFNNAHNFCVHRYKCKKTNACEKILICGVYCASCPTCNTTCKSFVRERCNRLDRAPYVCNGCKKTIQKCSIAHTNTITMRNSQNANIRRRCQLLALVSTCQKPNLRERIKLSHPLSIRDSRLIRSRSTTRNWRCLYAPFTATSIRGCLPPEM